MNRSLASLSDVPPERVLLFHKSTLTYGDLQSTLSNLNVIIQDSTYDPNMDVLVVYSECWSGFSIVYTFCALNSLSLEISSLPLQDPIVNTSRFQIGVRKKHTEELSVDAGIYISTSGSTGTPKKFLLSYERLYLSALSIKSYMKTDSADIHAWMMPYNYVYGLSMLNQVLLTHSSAVILDSSTTPSEQLSILAEYNVNKLYGVPSSILPYFKYFNEALPSSLKSVYTAGGRCPTQLAQQIISSGRTLCVMYGCTEASARLTYFYIDNIEDLNKGCVGYPIDGVRILASDNPDIPSDIRFLSHFSYIGSFSHDTFTPNTDMAISTGDLGFIHDNKLFITGRAGRFAKIAGNKVPLSFLESIFLSNTNISNVYFHASMSENDTDLISIFYECSHQLDYSTLRSLSTYPLYSPSVDAHKYFRTLLQIAQYIHYERFPLKANGKPDFSTLVPKNI